MVPPAPGVFPLGIQPRAGQNPPDGQTARRRRLKEERTGTSPAGVEVRAGRYPGMPGTWLALHRRVGWPALPPIFHPPPLVGFAGVGARRLALATGNRRLAPGVVGRSALRRQGGERVWRVLKGAQASQGSARDQLPMGRGPPGPVGRVVGGGRAGVPDGHLMERTALGALESPGAQLALGMAGSTAHLRCGGFWGPSIHIRASTTSSRIIVLVSTRHSLSALLRRARRRHLRYLKRDARGRHRCPMKAAFSIQLCLRSNLIAWILNAVWHRRTSFIPLGPSIEQSSIQPKTASSQLERKRLALAPSAAADEAAVRSSTRPSPSIPSDSCQNGPLLQYSVPSGHLIGFLLAGMPPGLRTATRSRHGDIPRRQGESVTTGLAVGCPPSRQGEIKCLSLTGVCRDADDPRGPSDMHAHAHSGTQATYQ
ncbi:hypothetical protein PCL_09211 [Purpureocillium lilacinum]|uniref:Uncharacterized protein n=1 Tax=Purpureocillium lilacinum TaxID=33203 RepID=A0A2U3EHC6_PURLI|nr:hypothetical protein PCL_09211 [Purpureocillium lilacinum]